MRPVGRFSRWRRRLSGGGPKAPIDDQGPFPQGPYGPRYWLVPRLPIDEDPDGSFLVSHFAGKPAVEPCEVVVWAGPTLPLSAPNRHGPPPPSCGGPAAVYGLVGGPIGGHSGLFACDAHWTWLREAGYRRIWLRGVGEDGRWG